ncbi:MAG: hypothetical protein VST68_05200, partial [Nitrospirota bacterium]|nr:hypothetical protein [Nitrospirota bacterium]
MVKKACPREGGGSVISPAQSQGRQDAFFHTKGRTQFGSRSVLTGCERERCGGLEVCEPEGPENWRECCWRLLRPGS